MKRETTKSSCGFRSESTNPLPSYSIIRILSCLEIKKKKKKNEFALKNNSIQPNKVKILININVTIMCRNDELSWTMS